MKLKLNAQSNGDYSTAVQFAVPLALAACALTGDTAQNRISRPVL